MESLGVLLSNAAKIVKQDKCLVIGVGNRFRSDDAVGLVAVAHLQKRSLPLHVEVIEGGTDEFSLIEHFRTAEHVVVIDAVSAGKPPGTTSIFTAGEVKMIPTTGNMALHGFGLADVIALAKVLNISPKITIVGIEPQSTELGGKLTPFITSMIPALVQTLLNRVIPGI